MKKFFRGEIDLNNCDMTEIGSRCVALLSFAKIVDYFRKKQVLYSLTSNGYTILHSRYIKNTKNKIKFLNSIDNKGINQLYNLKV